MKKEKPTFDFKTFEEEAIKSIREGKPLPPGLSIPKTKNSMKRPLILLNFYSRYTISIFPFMPFS
jgi:hypothetical protein